MKIHYIEADSLNNLAYKAWRKILEEGTRVYSRNGDCISLYDVELILNDVKSRHLQLKGRTNNIFAVMAEILWVMSGKDEITPFLSFFIPRAPNYSDDGKTWRAAYGRRIFDNEQLQSVIDFFFNEGLETRRAVISIYNPELDTLSNLKKVYNLKDSKDMACNLIINFFVKDSRLCMKVFQRSGDSLFGTLNINLPEFSFLLETLHSVLKKKYKNLKLGYYHHSVTNLHIYEEFSKQIYDVYSYPQKGLGLKNTDDFKLPFVNQAQIEDFFSSVVEILTEGITNKLKYNELLFKVRNIFDNFDVSRQQNIVWAYVMSVCAYIASKNFEDEEIELNLSNYSREFTYSIENSHFRKPNLKVIV